MNLSKVIENLSSFFRREGIDFALIGAFALSAYGYVRATRDVDFVVRGKDQQKIVGFLESLGYETLHRSTGFSNHLHPLVNLGRIDFVYVDDNTAEILFTGAKRLPVLEELSIPVLRVEHLIALKVFAMKNDPRRTFREMADIEQLMRVEGIDREEVRRYFKRYGQQERFDELTREE